MVFEEGGKMESERVFASILDILKGNVDEMDASGWGIRKKGKWRGNE